MDAILLTWRWQNILSIWLMVIALYFLITLAAQARLRMEGNKAASDG